MLTSMPGGDTEVETMNRKSLLFLISFVLLALACRLSGPGRSDDGKQPGIQERDLGVSAAEIGPHRSQFILEFDGEQDWIYRLDTAYGSSAVGRELDIEGVPLSVSPGDVRLIIENGQVEMTGEATGGECWVFPEKNELRRSFLAPDSVFQPEDLELELEDEDDRVAGRTAARYAVGEGFGNRWQDLEGTLWVDAESGAVLEFRFTARGQDPFFNFGAGQLDGDFRVVEFGVQELAPIDGCELPYPVPEDAREVVLLEEYMAFRTDSSRSEMITFYAGWLEDEGWSLVEGPDEGEFGTAMTFQQGDRLKQVSAREVEGGTQVEIFSEAAN